MDMFSKPVLLMALAIFLAVGTERLVELIRALVDHLEARGNPGARWQTRAEALRDRIEARLNNAGAGSYSILKMALGIVCRDLSPAAPETGGLIAVYADRVRATTVRVSAKLVGILLGVGLASIFGLDMFALVRAELPETGKSMVEFPGWLGTIATGIAMGLGAGPVHKLITALERARRTRL